MRALATITVLSLSTVGLSHADPAAATIRQISIPPQALEVALRQYSAETGFHVIYISEDVRARRSAGATGRFTADQALTRILSGTGLTYRFLDANTISIVPGGSGTGVPRKPPTGGAPAPKADDGGDGRAVPNGSFRMAQADGGRNSRNDALSDQPAPTAPAQLEEVVVTAEKRAERIIDAPIPIFVVTANTLLNTNQTELHNYYNQVPGLSVAQLTIGPSAVAIRGITTGINQNPTVGFTLDDVPLGSSTGTGGLGLVPEVNPADLARVEVLQGPQGTLYGASSLGGLIRFVTLDPSTRAFSGTVDVGGSGIENAGQLGYHVDGAVNVPLSDTVAVRASAFERQTPGYIDNVESGQKGINAEKVYGSHLSLLWQITPDMTLKLGAVYEKDKRNGSNDVDVPTAGFPQTTGLHGLEQYYLPGTGGYDRRSQIYDAVLTAHVGGVELTSITGYNVNSFNSSDDLSGLFGANVSFPNQGKTQKFSEELRALAHLGRDVDLLIGGFYTHENSPFSQQLLSIDPSNGGVLGVIYNSISPTKYEEEAAFGDLTWRLTDKFDVQLGARESHLSVDTLTAVASGLGGGTTVTPATSSPADVFTYLVTPRYKLTSDVMVYGRVASGYRPGGANSDLCTVENFPCHYNPDRTTDYEVGLKGIFAGGKLSLDGSVYYIQWHDFQLDMSIDEGRFSFTGNGGSAKSQGLQLSAHARPLNGLELSGWVAYDDAALTQALPPGPDYGVSGSRLPYSAHLSGNLSAQQSFPISVDVSGYVGAALIYMGQREGEFTGTPVRTDLPAYTQVNLDAGVEWDRWKASLYATNIGDVRGVVFGGLNTSIPYGFQYIQPRTIGVNLSRDF